MPTVSITAAGLLNAYGERLGLQWLGGKEAADEPLFAAADERSIVGHLNFIHPHLIQVLGTSELDYLKGLGKNSYKDALQHLFSGDSRLVIVTEGQTPPKDMRQAADRFNTPLFGSVLPSERVVEYLDYYLAKLLANKITVHGVLMDVMGIGVLLTGESGVGKSELALELITRGHYLIADDAPEFVVTAPDILTGYCPQVIHGFLEVRGLGVLDIRAMFGDSAIKQSKILRLIIDLMPMDNLDLDKLDRLRGSRRTRQLLDVNVPEIVLPVGPGRNLAVLVEAAARDHMLRRHGIDAAEEFIARQQRHIRDKSQ